VIQNNNTSVIEGIFNAITHGIGIILSAVGLVILLKLAGENYNSAKSWL